jgi:uncharacterized protein (DUF488 family)
MDDELCIWTVGHSTHPLEVFLDLLAAARIDALADIRRFPGSRRHPQFSHERLAGTLPRHGIRYEWFEALGGRRSARPDSVNTAWRNAAFRGYADYMQTAGFEAALDGLIALARGARTAIMCAEAMWWQCHRSLVADALTARGVAVQHIMGPAKVTPHNLTAPARIVDGRLTYAPPLL